MILYCDIMKGIPRLIGYGLALSFFTLTLVTSTFTTQIQLAYAGGKSPYESGYDHGCNDADISDPDDRYINQPERGPSSHTDEFMDGYRSGFDNCSASDNDSDDSDDNDDSFDRSPSRGSSGINWEQLCMDYGNAIDIDPEDCSDYANGNQLTAAGRTYLVEKLKDAARTISTLATILGPFL